VVDEHGTYYKEFPIARYRCYAKGKRKIPHSTFSLLPHQLIPYTRYSIPFIMKILEELSLPDSAIDAAIDYVAGLGKDDILSISAIKIRILKGLGIEAIERIQVSGYYKDIHDEFNVPSIRQRLRVFMEFAKGFCCQKTDSPIRGPCGLSYDFYLQGGSYYNNALFLFGTPSQFRI